MTNSESLKVGINKILNYEFDIGYYGLERSEYTPDIIEYEVKNILRHKKLLDTSTKYLFSRVKDKVYITSIDSNHSLEDLINDKTTDAYLMDRENVAIISFDAKGNLTVTPLENLDIQKDESIESVERLGSENNE